MPRPRLPEAPQRSSPRGPPSLRTSSSDSDRQRPHPRTDRNPKPSEGRSIRAAQSEPSSKPKKLGTRIANLESQLGLAQEELKSLKGQLVSTDSPKKIAQDELDKKPKSHIEEKDSTPNNRIADETTSEDDIKNETDVFEVLVEKLADEPKSANEEDDALVDELALKNNEINSLKDKEIDLLRQENERLKSQLDERAIKVSSAEANIQELTLRLSNTSQELEKTKTELLEKYEKLEFSEKAREELENEMKRLRAVSEQWRKAADAAASVLAGGMENKGQRLSERCGSMDKVYTNSFEGVGRYVESPGLGADGDYAFGGEKRKSSVGIKMLGELWKKKGQK